MKQSILDSLNKSILPDTHSASQALRQFAVLSESQILPHLLQIVVDHTLDQPIKLASLIQLKIAIQNRWKPNLIFKPKDIIFLTQYQKEFVKVNLLGFFLRCQGKKEFNKLLHYIVETVIRYEHKVWMPTVGLLEGIRSMENSIENVERALEFVLCVSGAFEKIGKSEVYTSFCEQVMPLFEKVMIQNNSGRIVYLLSKVYWRAVNSFLNPYFQAKHQLWMNFLGSILISYNEQLHASPDKVVKYSDEFYYFQSKKWATRSVMKFIMAESSSKFPALIREVFVKRYLKTFIESIFTFIPLPTPPKLKYFQLRVLFFALNQSSEIVHPYKSQLQHSFLQKLITSPQQDYAQVRNQPLEYLHKQSDDCWGFTNLRMASISLWTKLVNKQSMEQNLRWVCEKIKSNNVEQLELGLSLMISMGPLQSSLVMETIPSVLQYLVEKMNSQNTEILIKYRILELISTYPTAHLSPLLLQHILSPIVGILLSPSNKLLTIKSIQALNNLLCNHDQAIPLIQLYINKILQELLKFLSCPDSQDLVPNFYLLINNLKHHLCNHLVQLIGYFVEQFLRFSKEYNDAQLNDEVYDGKVEDAAVGCLGIIETLLQVATQQKLVEVQGNIIRVIEECFTENGLEYYGDGLNLLNVYIFKRSTLSPSLLFFYPCLIYRIIGIPATLDYTSTPLINPRQNQIFENIKSNANPQCIQKSFPALRNYIYKCPQVLSSNTDFFNNKLSDLMIGLIETIQNKSKPENSFDCIELLSMWSLTVYILENTDLTEITHPIIKLLFQREDRIVDSDKESYVYLKRMWSVLWCTCAYREPELMMRVVQIQVLKDSVKGLEDHQKKRIIVGLCSVLENQGALRYCRENNLAVFDLIKIANEILQDGTIFDEMDQEDDIEFSEKLDTYFVSHLTRIDEVECLKRVISGLAQRYPEIQQPLSHLFQFETS